MACTQEVKVCPDGSSVGRTGSDCSFAPCPTATPTPSFEVLPITDPHLTANWKTYTNQQKDVTFKYPPDWILKNLDGSLYDVQLSSPDLIDQGVTNDYVSHDISQGTIILFRFDHNYPNPNVPLEKFFITNFLVPGSIKHTTIDGKEAISLLEDVSSIKKNPNEYLSYYILSNDKKNYYLITRSFKISQKTQYENIFNQILSTFKFINTSTAAPSPTTSQKISCNTASDCPSGDTCTVWGPIRVDGPQNKYCTAPGQAVPL